MAVAISFKGIRVHYSHLYSVDDCISGFSYTILSPERQPCRGIRAKHCKNKENNHVQFEISINSSLR